jgi:hypothetical protein
VLRCPGEAQLLGYREEISQLPQFRMGHSLRL